MNPLALECRWDFADADFRADDDLVRSLLAGLPDPGPMPPGLVGRIEARLDEERRAGAGARVVGFPTPQRVPPSRRFVIGLAAVIVGESILPSRRIVYATLAVIIGAIVYRFFIALALNSDFIGLKAQDLNLVTAVLVTVALIIPQLKRRLKSRRLPDAPKSL